MFFEYYSKVDRGRVSIPSMSRHHFETGLELALDEENKFVAAHPCPESESKPMKSRDASQKLDARGRLTIPKAMRHEVNIVDIVVIVGSDDYLEIWNPLRWEEEKAHAQQQIPGR